jgi:hypothetical protein
MAYKRSLIDMVYYLPNGTSNPGNSAGSFFSGLLADKGERLGGAFTLGYAKGYYGDKMHRLDLWGGLGAMALATLIRSSRTYRTLGLDTAEHLERLGDVGLASALGDLGMSMGADKAGRVVKVSSGKK